MKKKWLLLVLVLFAVFTISSCKKKPTIDPPAEDTVAPMINGVMDVVIEKGEAFDPMAGVTANDDVDGNITSKIKVTGTVDVNVPAVYELTYEVSDTAGNKTTKKRNVTVRDTSEPVNLITNGDFSQPLENGWTTWSGEGGAATFDIVDGVAVIDVTALGNQWWSIQFSHPNIALEQGQMYELKLDLKVENPRDIVIKLENPSNFGYIDEIVNITKEMATYTFEFFMTQASLTNAKLIIGPGNVSGRGGEGALGKVYVDNVSLMAVEPGEDTVAPEIHGAYDKSIALNDPFDPLEGITVSDNRDLTLKPEDIVITGSIDITKVGVYEVTYTLKDASGNETVVVRKITVVDGVVPSTWLVVNGDFEIEQLAPLPQPAETGWGWHGAGTFTAKIEGGIAVIDIENVGTVAHGVQFYQQNRIITQGQIYEITFKAKADIPRPIMFALEAGTARKYDEIIYLSSEWAEYTIMIDFKEEGFSNGKFAFFMGLVADDSVPTTIYFDYVRIETVEAFEDKTAPQLEGLFPLVVGVNKTYDPLAGVIVKDNADKALTVNDIVLTGEVKLDTIGNYTQTYSITDASGNVATYERSIKVVALDQIPTSEVVIANADFSVDQSGPMPQPAETGWGWHGAGTFTAKIEDGMATINVTNVGTVPHGVQFYQQNKVFMGGGIYKLTFRAKALDATPMRISIEAGTNLRYFKVVDITTEWVTHEVIIHVSGKSYTNGKVGFFMGKVTEESVPTTFNIDDVAIEQVGYREDRVKPIISGAKDISIEKGTAFDAKAGVYVFDNLSALTVNDIVITGDDFDINVAGEYTVVYTLKDEQNNEVVVNRKVTVLP